MRARHLAGFVAALALLLACNKSPVEPTSEMGFAVEGIPGEVYVRNFTGETFDPYVAAQGIRRGYDRIAIGSQDPTYIYAQSLDHLRIGVYTVLSPPYNLLPSVFMPPFGGECQLVAHYEYLTEGCLMHRLCNQPRIRVSAPGCSVVHG